MHGLGTPLGITLLKGETGVEGSRNPLQKARLYKECQKEESSIPVIKTVNINHSQEYPPP